MTSKPVLASLLVLALAGCGTFSGSDAPGPDPADEAEVGEMTAESAAGNTLAAGDARALFGGAVASGTTATGVAFDILYGADGRATLNWRYLGGSGTDTGSWRVADDGALCVAWQNTDGGTEHCEYVLPQPDGSYRRIATDTGELRASFTLEAAA